MLFETKQPIYSVSEANSEFITPCFSAARASEVERRIIWEFMSTSGKHWLNLLIMFAMTAFPSCKRAKYSLVRIPFAVQSWVSSFYAEVEQANKWGNKLYKTILLKNRASMIAFWAPWAFYKNFCLINWSITDKELKIFASSHFRRYQLLLTQLQTLNSAGIAAFDDKDESKGIW